MLIIWGTRLVGKKNIYRHGGICRNCGRRVELLDYETRQWFTLYFLPIIPLNRKQIVDHCPVCKARHTVQPDAYRRKPPLSDDSAEGRAFAAIERGAFDEGRKALLAAAENDEPVRPIAWTALIRAHQRREAHAEALGIAAEVLAEHPELAESRPFRKLVRASEKALPLHERVLPARSLLRSKAVGWAAVAVSLLAVGFGVNAYMARHRTVHVVNGLAVPVELRIDNGTPVRVAKRSREKITVPQGRHRATWTAAGQKGKAKFVVEPLGFIERFSDRRIRVLMPFAAGAVSWERVAYARGHASAAPGGTGQKVHVGKTYVTFDRVDYPFGEFPASLDLKGGLAAFKTRLAVATVPTAHLAMQLASARNVPTEELMRFVESHLMVCPDEEFLLWSYQVVAKARDQLGRFHDFVGVRLADRPVRIQWHRVYQNARESAGDGAAVLAEYDRLLAEKPNNSALLYLRGRLETRVSLSLSYMRRSIAADAKNPYPRMATAYDLMAAGEFASARAAAQAATRLDPDNAQIAGLLWDARLAMGEFEALATEARAKLSRQPTDMAAQGSLLLALTAMGKPEAAREAQEAFEAALDLRWPQGAKATKTYTRMNLLALEGKYEDLFKAVRKARLPRSGDLWSFPALMELGRVDEAVKHVATNDITPRTSLLISVAFGLEGRSGPAAEWREKAREGFAAGDGDQRAAAELLAHPDRANVARGADMVLRHRDKAVVLVALVQAGADPKLLALAEKLNFVPGFPRDFLKRAIDKAGASPRD